MTSSAAAPADFDLQRKIYDPAGDLASKLGAIASVLGAGVGATMATEGTLSSEGVAPTAISNITDGLIFTSPPVAFDATWGLSVIARGKDLVDCSIETSIVFSVRDRFYAALRDILWDQLADRPQDSRRLVTAFDMVAAWEAQLLFAGIGIARAARDRVRSAEYRSKLKAIDRSQICIEFDLSGTILDANDNFLELTGYTLREIQGNITAFSCAGPKG